MSAPTPSDTADVPPPATTETAVDRVAATTRRNLGALTPVRILALFTLVGFVYLGAELGPINVSFTLSLLAFAYFAVSALHTWNRKGKLTGVDAVVAGHVVVAVILVGTEVNVLAVPGVEEWSRLLILGLIMADGFVAHRS